MGAPEGSREGADEGAAVGDNVGLKVGALTNRPNLLFKLVIFTPLKILKLPQLPKSVFILFPTKERKEKKRKEKETKGKEREVYNLSKVKIFVKPNTHLSSRYFPLPV